MENLLIIAFIFVILFVRHVGSSLNAVLDIIDTQTRSIGKIKRNHSYNTKVLTFAIEGVRSSLEFIYTHGNTENKKDVMKIVKRFEEEMDE